MVRCEYCGKPIRGLPYRCKYCGAILCVEHHLPENHNCPGLKRGVWVSLRESRSERIPYVPPIAAREETLMRRRMLTFSGREVGELIIALIASIVAFLPLFRWLIFRRPITKFDILLSVFGAGLGIILHEIAHKSTAIKLGYPAYFKLSKLGVMLTFISGILPVKIIMPGEVLVLGVPSRRDMGYIALSGPLANIVLAIIFLLTSMFIKPFRYVAGINAYIAFFNLLPIPPLDGSKAISSNIALWVIAFVIALVMTIFIFY